MRQPDYRDNFTIKILWEFYYEKISINILGACDKCRGAYIRPASCIRTDRGNIQTAGADSNVCIYGDKDSGDGERVYQKKTGIKLEGNIMNSDLNLTKIIDSDLFRQLRSMNLIR